ncbi:MAG TPA: HNH endonuclease [Myxococcota bacterium]|nr:HNH endonuclease [Myxococcota bacterium]
MVHFWLDGRQYLVSAHRLVWTMTNGPIPDGMVVNHIDGVKANNAISNLEVVTAAENVRHAVRSGLRTYTNLARDLAPKALELRAAGLSYAAIARSLGVSQGTAFRATAQTL